MAKLPVARRELSLSEHASPSSSRAMHKLPVDAAAASTGFLSKEEDPKRAKKRDLGITDDEFWSRLRDRATD